MSDNFRFVKDPDSPTTDRVELIKEAVKSVNRFKEAMIKAAEVLGEE